MKTLTPYWQWMAGAAVLIGLVSLPAAAAAQAPGATAFSQQCAMCHGPDGSANTPVGRQLKAADLRSAAVQKLSDAQLQVVITKGDGKKMGAFASQLSPQQVAQVVNYLRTLVAAKPADTGRETASTTQP